MGDLRIGASTEDWELVFRDDDGGRLRIHPPIGAICIRCGTRADDISFLVEGPAGTEAGGFCGPCLVASLRQCAADGA